MLVKPRTMLPPSKKGVATAPMPVAADAKPAASNAASPVLIAALTLLISVGSSLAIC